MKNIVALTLIGLAVEAMAVTPVAVWDGDFTTTKKGDWTFNANGNTVAADGSTVTIGDTYISFATSTAFSSVDTTVILKYSDYANKDTYQTLITLSGVNSTSTPEFTDGLIGLASTKNGGLTGMWKGVIYTWKGDVETYKLPSSGRVAMCRNSSGVKGYVNGQLDNDQSAIVASSFMVNRVNVGASQYQQSTGTRPVTATGLKVVGIAIFNASLSQSEIASYKFPSDPKTYAATVSSGEVEWANLQWTPEGGGSPVSSAELPKNGILQVTVASGATLLVAGSDAAQVAQLDSITGPGTVRKVGDGTTTIAGAKVNKSTKPAAIEVAGGTLNFSAGQFFTAAEENVALPLTVTGGTLNLNGAWTWKNDGSGWLTQRPITLGGATVTKVEGGAVTFYNKTITDALIYRGNAGANAPAEFASNWHSSYSDQTYSRNILVEKGAGTDYDLLISGIFGLSGGQFANTTVHKTGSGTVKFTGTYNFPFLAIDAGCWQLGSANALAASTTVASGATLDLGGQSLTNLSITCTGTIANGTLVSSGVTVNLTGATLGDNLTLAADLANAVAGLKPFAGVDYAKVTTVGENKYLTYNTATGTFTLRDDCRLGDELKWLPIGDSITEGEQYMGHPGQGTGDSRGGYRYQLWNEFEQAGQITRSVGYRTGHSGTVEDPETCPWAWHAAQYGGVIMHDNNGSHGAAGLNVENTLEVAGYPDIVTVLIGVNDLSFTDGSVEQCGWVFTTWQNMVAKYADQRPHSKIVVSPLLPASGSRAYIARFNKIMRDAHVAGEAPFDRPNVVFADVPMIAFNDAYQSQYFKDGLHPNETGAKIVAAAWMSVLQPLIDEMAKSTAVPVQVHNGTSGKVSVRFSKAIKSIETATLTISGTNVNGRAENWTFTGPTIKSGDTRVVEFDTGAAVLIAGDYTAALTDVVGTDANNLQLPSSYTYTSDLHLNIHGSGAAANVPAAYRRGFERLQTIDITECNYGGNGPDMPCEKLSKAASITHVGYYVELQRANEAPQFVWVSMDAAPFGYATNNVGVPTVKGGIIRSRVTELQVYGNRGNFTNTAVGDTTQTGVIEFSPWVAGSAEPGGDFPKELKPGRYGWNDTLTDTSTLWGCMQVARETHAEKPDDYTRPAGEMIFAFNTFNSTALTDLGIGTFSTHRNNAGYGIAPVYDWTDFVEKTGCTPFMLSAYQVKKIEIWVKPPKTSMMLFVK